MARLIVFYDGECPLCNLSIRFLMTRDQKRQMYYAPLQGETARTHLGKHPPLNTLVLLEGNRLHRYGKAALRIAWHLGGAWKWLGVLSFLPGWVVNPLYRVVAQNRHLFAPSVSIEPPHNDRFLP